MSIPRPCEGIAASEVLCRICYHLRMASGRSNKPLFELLRQDTGAGMFGRRASAAFSELKPGDAPRARASYITIQKTWLYFGAATVLALVVAAWVIAYRSGHAAAEKELAGSLVSGVRPEEHGGVSEPGLPADGGRNAPDPSKSGSPKAPAPSLRNDASNRPITSGPQAPKPDAGSRSKPEHETTPSKPTTDADKHGDDAQVIALPIDDPSKPVLTSKGAADTDPREPGLNYMVLVGGLPRDDARTLVAYLSANGLETVGVPMHVVDRTGRVVNNEPLFKVVCIGGITGQQFRDKDPKRTTLEQAATRLNEQWMRDTKSRWRFAKTYWELLQGK